MWRVLAALVVILACEGPKTSEPEDVKEEPKKETETRPPVSLPTEAMPIYESVMAYRTASDSAAVLSAFGLSSKKVWSTFVQYGWERGRGYAISAHAQAYASISSDQADFSDRILGGKMFDHNGIVAPSVTVLPESVRRCPLFIVVQGILTSADAAVLGRHDVAMTLARLDGLSCAPLMWGFYNPTAKSSKVSPNCFVNALQLGKEVEISKCGAFGDIIEANRQIANLLNFWPGIEASSAALAIWIAQERGRGRPVVLVGHSQGALLIGEAIKAVLDLKQCLYVITMGSPLGKKSFNLPERQVRGYMLAGARVKDVVSFLGENDFMTSSSELTHKLDVEWESASLYRRLMMNVEVHSLSGSYMAEYWNTVLLAIFLRDAVDTLYKKQCGP